MHAQVRIGGARSEDRAAMERLLLAAGFTAQGLDDPRARWLVARLGDSIIGCGSVLLAGTGARIDNVAVASAHRHRSIGSTLVGMLVDHAAEQGAASACVVTRDASAFFLRLRWRPVSAGEAMGMGLTLPGNAQAFAVSLSERARVNAAQYVEYGTRVAKSLEA